MNASREDATLQFLLWPWLAAAGVLALAALVASPDLARQRMPAAAAHYAAFVVQGIAVARVCLLACSAMSALTGLALRRWGRLVEGESVAAVGAVWSWRNRTIMLGLTLAALALRIPTISASFWMDEINTVARVVDRGLPVILAFSSEGNNHQMNSLLMYLCKSLLGETEWVLRLPVLLLGVATPAVIFACLRSMLPQGAALTVALLAVVHFRYVEFSANARGYAGVILFSALASCLFARMRRDFRWRFAVGYITAATATASFVPTTVYVAVAHGIVAAFGLAGAWRRGASAGESSRAGAALGACSWAVLLGLSVNSLMIPQLIDYARHGAELAHRHMGWELATGIAYFMTGSNSAVAAGAVLLLSTAGLWRFRQVTHLAVALLSPVALYAGAVTVFGMRTSPRMYVQFIFPCVVGFGLFLYSELRAPRAAWHRAAALAIAAVFLGDSVPQFLRFYSVSNPPLKALSRRLEGAPVMLIGDQADINGYYFHGAAVVTPHEGGQIAERVIQARPRYLLGGIDCSEMKRGGSFLPATAGLGYRPVERLMDWTDGEQAGPSERQPCFLLLERRDGR